MDLLKYTIETCRKYGIRPARSKGQNFLVDESAYRAVIDAAKMEEDDKVLEVGPGLGLLTRRLAEKARKVTAVELDDKLALILGEELKKEGVGNVEVKNTDILEADPSGLEYNKIVANLPYNITSAFIRKFLSAKKKPEKMVLMLQKEVAERVCAGAGKMSILSVSVQIYANARVERKVGKESFWPVPEVDSAILSVDIDPEKSARLKRLDEKKFFQAVKIGFSARRKMLKNNLSGGLHISNSEAEDLLREAGLDPRARAQDLSVKDWQRIVEKI